MHAPVQTVPQRAFESPVEVSASFKDLAYFLVEIRQDAIVERVDLEAKLKAEHKAEMDKLRAELTPAPAQELVSAEQLAALQARLEQLHAAQLLTDEELFALENLCSDYLEVKAATAGPLTQELVYSSPAKLIVVSKLAKLVVVSEGLASDAGLARQVRRKFL